MVSLNNPLMINAPSLLFPQNKLRVIGPGVTFVTTSLRAQDMKQPSACEPRFASSESQMLVNKLVRVTLEIKGVPELPCLANIFSTWASTGKSQTPGKWQLRLDSSDTPGV